MYVFLRTLFVLIGVVSTLFLVVAIWADLQRMDPDNGHYMKGQVALQRGEAMSFDSLDGTPEGYAKRGFLLDLHLECRSGHLSLELLKWRLNLGKMSEADIQLHQPQAACRKRGLQTLF